MGRRRSFFSLSDMDCLLRSFSRPRQPSGSRRNCHQRRQGRRPSPRRPRRGKRTRPTRPTSRRCLGNVRRLSILPEVRLTHASCLPHSLTSRVPPWPEKQYAISPALAAVIGTNKESRPQCVSKIWDYIRSHNLQNPSDKREILCDDKLQAVFGQVRGVGMGRADLRLRAADFLQYRHCHPHSQAALLHHPCMPRNR